VSEARTLVVGATGLLGGVIARQLIAEGVPVRALGRNRQRLSALSPAADIAAIDLRDLRGLTEACRGVDQIVATANNVMGSGPTSPARIDLTGYQNLCAAARSAGVRRIVYLSYRGVVADAPVDFFRIKWRIEDAIRRSGIPYVMLRPAAFMDIWIDEVFAKGMREKGVATIFGDGTGVNNYIAVDDVAAFAVRILARQEIVNEAIEVGGPSNLSQNDLVGLVEARLGRKAKRRHVPLAALRLLPPIVRPFNELGARLMTLGFYAATGTAPFPGWTTSAERFGVRPRTVESYLEERTWRGSGAPP
jgi:uncharacterized protein YbjT (DUF2867 family)